MIHTIKDVHGMNRHFVTLDESEYPDRNSMVRVFRMDNKILCQLESDGAFYVAYFLDNDNEPFLVEQAVVNARRYPRELDDVVIEFIKQQYNETHGVK